MKKTAVALGVFDGVHIGHRAVLQAVHQIQGCTPGACTFVTEHMMMQKHASGYLYSSGLKQEMLKRLGMELIYMPEFSEIRNMTGWEFAKQILHENLHVEHVFCGKNFRFGAGASCDVQDLEKFGSEFAFQVHVIDEVQKDGILVSSTAIRKFVVNGEIEKAGAFLGEPYQIRQEVTHGAQLGRTIGFPTINQEFAEGQLVPKFGVYASETETSEGKFASLTNIGRKPTVDYQGVPLAETYLKQFSGDLYGKIVTVKLLRYIRPEIRFSSLGDLVRQMTKDLQS